MKTPLSPSDIEVLLHCHTTPVPHPRLRAPAVQEAIAMFLNSGMISEDREDIAEQDVYVTTTKGRVFVEALCNLPEPTCVWTCGAKKDER